MAVDLVAAPALDSRQCVYVVDDDESIRRSLSFLLRISGYEMRAFESGEDFLTEARLLDPGCVLLDVRMPQPDGLAVMKELGEELNRFVVVTMTGHGDIDTAVRAMKLGSLDFIQKPFAKSALIEVLDTAFSALSARLETRSERLHAEGCVETLTPREKEVLQGLITGESNKEVGRRLKLSARTVEMHRANLMARLRVKSVAQIVRLAVLAGVKPF